MRNIGETKIYLVPQLVVDSEHWINPRFGGYDLQTHYDNIKQMVKMKAGRAMQKKEGERKIKSDKIIKVAGYLLIREGALLIKPDTTLEDARRLDEECQERGGIIPLQIFLHKDEGYWLTGEPSQTIRRVFKSVVVDSNSIITPVPFSIGGATTQKKSQTQRRGYDTDADIGIRNPINGAWLIQIRDKQGTFGA